MGVYGSSTNNVGVFGTSANSSGVYGISTNSYGVYGTSTNNVSVYGRSINNYAGYFSRNTATPTSAVPVLFAFQDHASDTNSAFDVRQDGTGAIFRAFDYTSEVFRIDDGGKVGIGTATPTASLDVNSDILRLRTAKTPTSASDTGNAGDICWDADYVYVCVATNTWKRAAISTW